MRNARGEFAEGGQVFLDLHLALERREFGEVAEQAQRSRNPCGPAQDRRDGYAELA